MQQYSGYIFDLDGTIYLGNEAIDGAVDTINYLLGLGKKVLFLTNKTIESRQHYCRKLTSLGIPVQLNAILSPSVVTVHYLKRNHPQAKVYVIGEDILKRELSEQGILFADKPEETDVIVISWDREFHYSHLNFAYKAIKRGAAVIATHPDRTCPMPGGDVPDCGGMIGAVEGTTGMKVDIIMGKPSLLTVEAALDVLQLEAKDCLMTGDRLETDIRMGNEAGMSTALVLTGVTRREDIGTSEIKPTYVLQSVHHIGSGRMIGSAE
ncbi:HAD-IIA family hydrolase [Paenibacillus sp. J5C_2022]|uniref:HAD-IIA family hydrolase n=1 Tax=Paenibacillus sp. J5C2022 TaxID=2977129 RepID=UPI0021CFA09C|nr:HAD-IIA family hydrolase [Paenibacillus sp. J5C2022]MCU6707794.1 HAD-IIA family hydrolase [Paenibacillus sp. J5C2022]